MKRRKHRGRRPVLNFNARNGSLIATCPSMHAAHLLTGLDLRNVSAAIANERPIRGLVFRDAFPAVPTAEMRQIGAAGRATRTDDANRY